jgi:L-gulonolactone oxidase
MNQWENWAKLSTCTPEKIIFPKSLEELKCIVKENNATTTPIKVVGHGNSYNTIFHTKGTLVSLKEFNHVHDINTQTNTITFDAGLSIQELVNVCKSNNLGVTNLGTNMFDNIAGACATGHHGSGINYGILSSFIESFDLLLPSGQILTITKDDWLYDALGVHLGAMGIITKITLSLEKQFKLKQEVFPISLQAFQDSLPNLLATNDHVKLIWAPHTNDYQCWIANRTNEPNDSAWSHWKSKTLDGLFINNIIHGCLLYSSCINPTNVRKINRWLSSYFLKGKTQTVGWGDEIFHIPHLLKQDAVEYSIDLNNTVPFLQDLNNLIESQSFNVQFPIEIRFVKKDNFWLSPAYQADQCYIGTKSHCLPLLKTPYQAYFKAVNTLVETYAGRPHWAKQHYFSKEYLINAFPKWKDFWILQSLFDPNQLFMNNWLKTIAYTPTPTQQQSFKSQYLTNEILQAH